MIKVLTVLGARPQFIKAAAVSRAFAAHSQTDERIVHTGQHHDAGMSDVFFAELGIPAPAHHLGVAGGGHGDMTGRMMIALEAVVAAETPDWVLVYGDTNSTLAGALVAAKMHVPVAHVEAGLRSFNRRMPEEVNRVLTDHCADLLFTPTDAAAGHLRAEGIDPARIVPCGDVMFDAARIFAKQAQAQVGGSARSGHVLATVHRQENTDSPQRLAAILGGLALVAETLPVILPLHPRTRARIDAAGLASLLGAVEIVEPLGYLEMIALQRGAVAIATDSGGVQKEAFFHGVPCVTLRDETEWTELVDAGWNRLISPADAATVAGAILAARGTVGQPIRPYGDGNASNIIVERLARRAGTEG